MLLDVIGAFVKRQRSTSTDRSSSSVLWQDCSLLLARQPDDCRPPSPPPSSHRPRSPSAAAHLSSTALLRICRSSTPIKMLLFRAVSRLQVAYWRNDARSLVAKHLRSALDCTRHWQRHYAPTYTAMGRRHRTLTQAMQSAYVLVGIPYNLAVLLLTDPVSVLYAERHRDDDNDIDDVMDDVVRPEYLTALRLRACTDIAEMMWAIQRSNDDDGGDDAHDDDDRFDCQARMYATTHAPPTPAMANSPTASSFSSFSSSSPQSSPLSTPPYDLAAFFRQHGRASALLTEPWAEIVVHGLCTAAECDRQHLAEAASRFDRNATDAARRRLEAYAWGLRALKTRSLLALLAREEVFGGM